MSDLTPNQRDILKRVLGENDERVAVLCLPEWSDDRHDCEEMVEEGLMERHTGNWSPFRLYTVTPLGRRIFHSGEQDGQPT